MKKALTLVIIGSALLFTATSLARDRGSGPAQTIEKKYDAPVLNYEAIPVVEIYEVATQITPEAPAPIVANVVTNLTAGNCHSFILHTLHDPGDPGQYERSTGNLTKDHIQLE